MTHIEKITGLLDLGYEAPETMVTDTNSIIEFIKYGETQKELPTNIEMWFGKERSMFVINDCEWKNQMTISFDIVKAMYEEIRKIEISRILYDELREIAKK